MSNLITKTKAQAIAEQIDKSQSELSNHAAAVLRQIYSLVNTEGEQQAILDAFGPNAVQAVAKYATMREALLAINPDADIPAPNPEVFVIKAGKVTYVAPPEPEVEEE